MRARTARIGAGLLAALALLGGCGYERGYQNTTRATLLPVGESQVQGTAVIGYEDSDPLFRMKVTLKSPTSDVRYQIRFFEAPGCEAEALAHAPRIDGPYIGAATRTDIWTFDRHPVSLSGGFLGKAEEEFRLRPGLAPVATIMGPMRFPTIVVYAVDGAAPDSTPLLRAVACGRTAQYFTNHRPHT